MNDDLGGGVEDEEGETPVGSPSSIIVMLFCMLYKYIDPRLDLWIYIKHA